MSVPKVSVLVPPLRLVPPSAAWLADAAVWVIASARVHGTSLRKRLQESADRRRQVRARSEMVAMAQRYASTQPEFAKDLLAASKSDRTL